VIPTVAEVFEEAHYLLHPLFPNRLVTAMPFNFPTTFRRLSASY
jgi:hypothetical protein